MNVAQLIFTGSFAGAEAVACALTGALRGKVERSVLYLVLETRSGAAGCDEMVARARGYGIEMRVFEVDRRFSSILLAQLQTALAEDGIGVLHSHSYKGALYAQILRLRSATPLALVFTVHGFDQATWKGKTFLHVANGLSALTSDVVICVSDQLSTYYRKLGGRKVFTLANATILLQGNELTARRNLHNATRVRIMEQHRLAPDTLICGCVGRLVPVKNFSLLLRAAAQCRNHLPSLTFVIAGDGPLREALELERRHLGADNVHFLGHVSDVGALYRAMDVMVLTSDSEGSPMVVIEAMAHGVPVVGSSVGGVPDLIEDGRTGFLFAPGDVDACVRRLKQLASEPQLRASMGARAEQLVVERFNADVWAAHHLNLFRRALSEQCLSDNSALDATSSGRDAGH